MASGYQSYVFNFSASYSSGGLKRLLAYSNWFNEHGGARFIVSQRLKGIESSYPANRYRFLRQTFVERALNNTRRLEDLVAADGPVRLYYSYGIPLPRRVATVMWYHLSNVLTVMDAGDYVPVWQNYKYKLLRSLTMGPLRQADVISAESCWSLSRIPSDLPGTRLVSVNGSDAEIEAHCDLAADIAGAEAENVAVTVGTMYYKMLDDVYHAYRRLREAIPGLRLSIIGPPELIPKRLLRDPLVVAAGILPQSRVWEALRHARFYITATRVENSYNAAAEGVYLARESFISDIPPHRELLDRTPVEVRTDLGARIPLIHVRREDLGAGNLKSWNDVIRDVISTAEASAGNRASL